MIEFRGRKSALAWLEGQSREVQISFAARCALRALPGIGVAGPAALGDIALPVLRAMLTSGVAGTCPTPEVREAALSARSAALSVALSAARSAARSAAYSAARSATAARSAALSARSATLSADSAADSAALCADSAARPAAYSAAYSAAAKDAVLLDTAPPRPCFETPLWHDIQMPEGLKAGFDTLTAFWEADPETWGFWRDWYQGMLEKGPPMDWALQEQVALIPEGEWEKGAAHVGREISRIRTQHALEIEIERLKAALNAQQASMAQRSHNNPPELVEERVAIEAECTIVWATLKEAEEEISKEEPSPSTLRDLARKLSEIAAKFALYCVSLADVALKKAAAELGSSGTKWAIRAGTAYFAAQTQPVQAGLVRVSELLEKLAGYLP